MGLSKNITLTIKDYEIRLDKQIKFYENDTIDLCFSILEYGIEVKNGVNINKLMPIQALTAYMLIETPQGIDYAESTKIENNKIVFNLGAKYSQFVGIGHMQIVVKDSDGCRVTLPEFEFEIKKSINTDWDRDSIFLATEDDSIIIDEFGREIHMSKISDMPISENLSEESYTMIIDEEGNKRLKVKAIANAVEDSLDAKFNAYTDEISGGIEEFKDNVVERIEGEMNEISEALDDKAKKEEVQNIQTQVNNLVLESGGDSNLEVVQARDGFINLNESVSNYKGSGTLEDSVFDIKSINMTNAFPDISSGTTFNNLRIGVLPIVVKNGIKRIKFYTKQVNGVYNDFTLYLLRKTSDTTFSVIYSNTKSVIDGIVEFSNIKLSTDTYIAFNGDIRYTKSLLDEDVYVPLKSSLVNNILTVTNLEKNTFYYEIDYYDNADELKSVKTEFTDIKNKVNDLTNGFNYDIFDMAYIKNGELVCNRDNPQGDIIAKYTFADLKENCKTINAKVKFNGDGANLTLISNKNGMHKISDITSGSIHIAFLPHATYVGFYNRPTFEPQQIIEIVNYAKLDTTGNTEYEVGFELIDNTLTIKFPNGTTKSYTNENFSIVNGRYVCWEHFFNINEGQPIITEISAKGEVLPGLNDKFLRFDGAIGIAPTGHIYSQIRNFS